MRHIFKETELITREKLYQKLLFIFILFIPLAGCNTPNLENPLPELTFKHQSIIQLDVERIEIINDFENTNDDKSLPEPSMESISIS